jgi:hypothetical protein
MVIVPLSGARELGNYTPCIADTAVVLPWLNLPKLHSLIFSIPDLIVIWPWLRLLEGGSGMWWFSSMTQSSIVKRSHSLQYRMWSLQPWLGLLEWGTGIFSMSHLMVMWSLFSFLELSRGTSSPPHTMVIPPWIGLLHARFNYCVLYRHDFVSSTTDLIIVFSTAMTWSPPRKI